VATAAISGHGATLKRGNSTNGASTIYTSVSEVKDIPGPAMTRTIIDVTSQAAAGWKEKIAGLKDPGTISITINFVPQDATQSYTSGLIADFVSGVRRDFQIVFPDGGSTTWIFTAIIKGVNPSAPVDGAFELKVDFELCTAPTLA
jgi:predicted secreted protein